MSQEISIANTRNGSGQLPVYRVDSSRDSEDEAWDAFLAKTAGGHHVQTSLWGQVKALLGYQVVRVKLSQSDGTLLSGGQILIRTLPLIGRVGFVSKGPVFASNDPQLEERTIRALLRAARRAGIQCLIVQPPDNGEAIVPLLTSYGFQPVNILLAPGATVQLDLNKDLDTILAEMKSRTRHNIRLGQKKGLTIRQGTEADLPAFYEMLQATSRRQNFSIYPIEYYQKMWQVFCPGDHIQLFLTEAEGEVVSGLLLITFGNTVIYKMGAWSGQHGRYRPNEMMHWMAIEWSKANGYRCYDFEGVNADEVQEIAENKKPSTPQERKVTSFKVGFGGRIAFFPGAYLYVISPYLRGVYNLIWPRIAHLQMLRRLAGYIRTR